MTAIAFSRAGTVFERNYRVHRRTWFVIVSGFFEPLFYLFSMGIGLGHFVGKVPGPSGHLVSYASFIAPALLATAAMNGPLYDSTGVFWKMKYARLYDAMLSTPVGPAEVAVGETSWALFRGFLYAVAFLATVAALGLVHSAYAVLALPAGILVGFAFAGAGTAAATFMRTWQDFDYLNLVQLPMFLFSATFYPLSVYPHALQIVVRCTPLYNAIALMRALMLGSPGAYQLLNVAYLLLMGLIGLRIAGRRVGGLLLK